jgi:tRNA (cmo5U34)-methyltransferase
VTAPIRDFSFAEHVADFDEHIKASIPDLEELRTRMDAFSRYLIQDGTSVVDIGCSTGTQLARISRANEDRPNVKYVGIDVVKFGERWSERSDENIRFEVCDARSFGFSNTSLVCSLFTLQFLPEGDRLPLLRRVHDGLIEGGGLIIAEKILASEPIFQDMLTSVYYDFKRKSFSGDEVLDKEQRLRGQMKLWPMERLKLALREAGFAIEQFWQQYLFVGIVALKGPNWSPRPPRSKRSRREPRR